MENKLSKEEWILMLCRKHQITNTRDLTDNLIELWLKAYNDEFEGFCTKESFKRSLRKGKASYLRECGILEEGDIKEADNSLVEANVRFKKEKQKYQDTNRIERKSFREYARVENAVSEYAKEINHLLKEYGKQLSVYNPTPIENCSEKEIGMIQITDTHLNELIDLPHNKYDFKVASHRFYKIYKEAVAMFKSRGVEKIVVAFTGDLLNSDRRLDELLNQATNRSKATFIAADLIKYFLWALSDYFHVSVVSVLGNESRVNKEMPFSEEGLSDSYDFVIINMVKKIIEASGNKNIEFGAIDKVESIIELNGHKILLSHDIPKATATQKGTQSVVGMKYLQGSPIDCMIAGHIHGTNNQDYGYRSASLCGSNSYSDNALHVSGRASQNIYFFGRGYRHVMSLDLQNYVDGEWFDLNYSLMEYHAKSLSKTKKQETIMSIII